MSKSLEPRWIILYRGLETFNKIGNRRVKICPQHTHFPQTNAWKYLCFVQTIKILCCHFFSPSEHGWSNEKMDLKHKSLFTEMCGPCTLSLAIELRLVCCFWTINLTSNCAFVGWNAYHDSESGYLKSTNSIHCSITSPKGGLTVYVLPNDFVPGYHMQCWVQFAYCSWYFRELEHEFPCYLLDGFVKFKLTGPILWFPFIDLDGIVCISLLVEIRTAIGWPTGLETRLHSTYAIFVLVGLCRLKILLKSCLCLFVGFNNVLLLKSFHGC